MQQFSQNLLTFFPWHFAKTSQAYPPFIVSHHFYPNFKELSKQYIRAGSSGLCQDIKFRVTETCLHINISLLSSFTIHPLAQNPEYHCHTYYPCTTELIRPFNAKVLFLSHGLLSSSGKKLVFVFGNWTKGQACGGSGVNLSIFLQSNHVKSSWRMASKREETVTLQLIGRAWQYTLIRLQDFQLDWTKCLRNFRRTVKSNLIYLVFVFYFWNQILAVSFRKLLTPENQFCFFCFQWLA